MDRAKIVYPPKFLQSRCIIKVLKANFNILFLKLEVDKTWLSHNIQITKYFSLKYKLWNATRQKHK